MRWCAAKWSTATTDWWLSDSMKLPTKAYEFNHIFILDMLEEAGCISPEQRRRVEIYALQQRARLLKEMFGSAQAASEARYQISPLELLASFNLTDNSGEPISDEYLARLLAKTAGLPFLRIDPLKLDSALITGTFSRPFATRNTILPLSRSDEGITLALENPFDQELREHLARLLGPAINYMVAPKSDIIKSIAEVYGFKHSVQAAAKDQDFHDDAGQMVQNFEQLINLKQAEQIEANDKHIVNAVDFMLNYAYDQRASDIHIEPRRGDSQIRLRIDGVLHDTQKFPKSVHPAFVSRLKNMARLDIAEKRRPQDGRIKTKMGNRETELRVSTMPVAFGEKVVIRIFDPDVLVKGLPDLGFYPEELNTFNEWIQNPNGIILITGPTGSGKTTTLYTTLNHLSSPDINVITVEDPIEMVVDTFNQVAVQAKIGVTFAAALRTILRQDPDLIMIGEIRDKETAEMAIQAALTGHLVFSTLHTNDTAGAVSRLLELGIEPFLLKSTLRGSMAQRLLRKICPNCREETFLSEDQAETLGLESSAPIKVYRGAGCSACRFTGFKGRISVFELMTISAPIQQLIKEGADARRIEEAATDLGMRHLRDAAVQKLLDGETSFEEVIRVMGL